MEYLFTFIIAYKYQPDRLKSLRRVLDWINNFQKVQVILVEQDTHSKISHLSLKCQHIFVKANGPFNKSWAYNIGLNYAKTNVIVFGDSDIIMNHDDFIAGLNALQTYDMVSPYNSVLDLTEDESMLQLPQMCNINRPGRGETDIQKINIGGGITMFRRDAIMKIGGFSENFLGWGAEDDFQAIKIKKFLNWVELKARCFHLYHNRGITDMKLYQRNLQLLQQASKMSDQDISRSIGMSMNKIGMKNKYDNF